MKTLTDFCNESLSLFESNGTFSFDELKTLTSFSQIDRYCKTHLGKLIKGTRFTKYYQLPNGKIIEIATSKTGADVIDNNYSGYKDIYKSSIIPEIDEELSRNDGEDTKYVVFEPFKTAKTADFKRLLGIDFNTFRNFINMCFYEKSPKRDYAFLSGSMDKDEYVGYVNDESDKYNETLSDIDNYIINYNPLYGDMSAKNSWGIQKDEYGDDKLVFLYYGMNKTVYDNYDKNRRQRSRY